MTLGYFGRRAIGAAAAAFAICATACTPDAPTIARRTAAPAVSTPFTVNQPHPATTPANRVAPNQTMLTIRARLLDARVDWVWYSGGWNDALTGHADPDMRDPLSSARERS